jgi:hypothetical protein
MKIAVVYSGLPRYIPELFAHHREKLFTNCSATIHTYFHFWDIWGLTYYGWARDINHTNSPRISVDEQRNLIRLMQPRNYVFESFESATTKLQSLVQMCQRKLEFSEELFKGNPRSYVYQFYSLYKAFSLIQEKYDVVIRLRTDIEFTGTNASFIVDNAVHTYAGYCYPDMNDQMGYGSQYAMQKYAETFLNLGMLNKVHPESLLYEQLVTYGISVKKDWNMHYTIKREPETVV